jgi:hypothetical protein
MRLLGRGVTFQHGLGRGSVCAVAARGAGGASHRLRHPKHVAREIPDEWPSSLGYFQVNPLMT